MEFYTIGVYNSTEQEYFKKLTSNKIDTFCDIRQIRGVRGALYSFVNSNRLQTKLKSLKIKYFHITGLAPTTEMRAKQKTDDAKKGKSQRSRESIGEAFAKAYTKTVLSKFDFDAFLTELKESDAKKVVLFCVEENPEACHRSIVAAKLKKLGYKITHL